MNDFRMLFKPKSSEKALSLDTLIEDKKRKRGRK
jgi:hypothetical protein